MLVAVCSLESRLAVGCVLVYQNNDLKWPLLHSFVEYGLLRLSTLAVRAL